MRSNASEFVDDMRDQDVRMAREDARRARRMQDEIEYSRSPRRSRSPPQRRPERPDRMDRMDRMDRPERMSRQPSQRRHSNRFDDEEDYDRPPNRPSRDRPQRLDRIEDPDDPLRSTEGHNLGGFIRRKATGDKRIKKPLLGGLFKSREEDQYNIRRPRSYYDDDRRSSRLEYDDDYDTPPARNPKPKPAKHSRVQSKDFDFDEEDEEPFPSSKAGSKEFYDRTDPRSRAEPPSMKGRRTRCDGIEQPKRDKRASRDYDLNGDRYEEDERMDIGSRRSSSRSSYDRPKPKPSRIDNGGKPDREERVRRLKEVQDEYRKSKDSLNSLVQDQEDAPPPPSRPRPSQVPNILPERAPERAPQRVPEDDYAPPPPPRQPRDRKYEYENDVEEEPKPMGRPPSYSEPLPLRPHERARLESTTEEVDAPQLPRKPFRGARSEKSEYPEYFEDEQNEPPNEPSHERANDKISSNTTKSYEKPQFDDYAPPPNPPPPKRNLVQSAQKLQQFDEPVRLDEKPRIPPSPPSRPYERAAPKLPSPPPPRRDASASTTASGGAGNLPKPPPPVSRRRDESEYSNVSNLDYMRPREPEKPAERPAERPADQEYAPPPRRDSDASSVNSGYQRPPPPKPVSRVSNNASNTSVNTLPPKPKVDLQRKPTKVLPKPEVEDEAAFLTNARANLRQSRVFVPPSDDSSSDDEQPQPQPPKPRQQQSSTSFDNFERPQLRPPSPRRNSSNPPKPSEAAKKIQELRAVKPVLKPKPATPEAIQRMSELKPARQVERASETPAEAVERMNQLKPKSFLERQETDPNLDAITAQLRKMRTRNADFDDRDELENSNDSSDSLNHITKTRAKGPRRRPPTLD